MLPEASTGQRLTLVRARQHLCGQAAGLHVEMWPPTATHGSSGAGSHTQVSRSPELALTLCPALSRAMASVRPTASAGAWHPGRGCPQRPVAVSFRCPAPGLTGACRLPGLACRRGRCPRPATSLLPPRQAGSRALAPFLYSFGGLLLQETSGWGPRNIMRKREREGAGGGRAGGGWKTHLISLCKDNCNPASEGFAGTSDSNHAGDVSGKV